MSDEAIFVPGLLCTEELFAQQIEALRGQLDISIGDHRTHDTLARTAEDILANAPERFVLAGLSMGGYISFEILRQAPERVRALVLMDTTARPDLPEQTEFRKGLVETARSDGLDPVVEMLLPKFLAEKSAQDPAIVGTVKGMAAETGVEAFCSQQAMIISRPDYRPTLGNIRCPAMIIVGENDTLTPPEVAVEISEGIPGAEFAMIADAGHLPTIENPHAVSAAIKAFLEEAGIKA